LNYSSDVDLIAVYDDQTSERVAPEVYKLVIERLNQDLSGHTVDGYAYRLDFRLRPYGGSGEAASSFTEIARYYQAKASLWEIQALLKLRPVAGNLQVGVELLERLRPLLCQRRDPGEIVRSIKHMRGLAVKHRLTNGDHVIDVKSGVGGIRDIEFLVQGLQLRHASADQPGFLTGNTIDGLRRLARCGFLPADQATQLETDYVFLRRIEHYLQIKEDRQIHALPTDPDELLALARRILGRKADVQQFNEALEACFTRVREAATHVHSDPGETGTST
jgi:glutamate-ammonia-ligase adenylyltransferase